MAAVVGDTHAIVWYLTQDPKLSSVAADSPERPARLVPMDRQVLDAVERVSRMEVPDMPDRIVAASALSLGLPLISRDSKIRASQVQTIW